MKRKNKSKRIPIYKEPVSEVFIKETEVGAYYRIFNLITSELCCNKKFNSHEEAEEFCDKKDWFLFVSLEMEDGRIVLEDGLRLNHNCYNLLM
jgi:hypothetical protein